MFTFWGVGREEGEEGKDLSQKPAATEAMFTKNVRQVVDWAARRKYPIGVGAYHSLVRDRDS
ncbi:MAG: hypothetical protein HY673_22220 [Chloroflexi bacterium]|nr:hypothetical protein [Chloroflexota bacterium]